MTAVACADCGAPASVEALPEVAMEDAEVLLRVRGLLAASCPAGHRTLVPKDALARSRRELGAQLLWATTRGVVRRRDTCGACGADLVLPPRHTDTPVPFDVDGQVLTVVVEAAMARCPDCGREQVTASVGERVDAVLAACVDRAAVPGP